MTSASNNDLTAYERNVAVMVQVYEKKSSSIWSPGRVSILWTQKMGM